MLNKKRDGKKRPNAASPLMMFGKSGIASQRSYSQDVTELNDDKDTKYNIKMANKIVVGAEDTADYKTL